jgi:diaminopimelate decarboxylase
MDNNVFEQAIMQIPTPFYLFDEIALQQQFRHVQSLLPKKTAICYAMKANPFIVGQIASLSEKIEVCSPGELHICHKLGIPDSQLVISGVYKDPTLMESLICNHPDIDRYTVESIAQFDLLESLATDQGRSINLLMRLTSGNQFGMCEEETKAVIKRCVDNPHVTCAGIQFFSGTQKTSLKRLRSELTYLDDFVVQLEYAMGARITELEYGAGLPALYFDEEREAEVRQDELTSGLKDVLESLQFRGMIVLELGRSIAASCGMYAARIVDMKTNDTGRYAIVDGGRHQISYYGNALAMKQPPCHLWAEKPNTDPEKWNICGSLCTVNDILAKQLELCNPQIGDVLVFERAGAYCMTEGLSLFLSRDLPRVAIRGADGTVRIARDRVETNPFNMPSPNL